jgi:hypothetical protein
MIKHIGDTIYLNKNPIKSHILGLLKIDGLNEVKLDNKVAEEIINRELDENRSILSAIRDLTEAGLEEFAKL